MAVWGNFHGVVKNKSWRLLRIGNATITSNKGRVYAIAIAIPGDVNDGKYTLAHPPGLLT